MSKYKRLLRDTVIFSIGSLGSKLIVFLLVPLYTNILTRSEYGIADLVFTISQLLIPIFSMVIFDAVIRFGFDKDEKKENVLLNSIIVWGIGSCVSILFVPILQQYASISEWKWYIIVLISANILLPILLNYLKVIEKNVLFSLASIFQTFSLAILNIIFLVFLKLGIKGYLLSSIFASILTIIFCMIFGKMVLALKRAKLDLPLLKKMLYFSAPLVFNNLSWWVIQSSDKLMIEMMSGAAMLGIYTVATRLPSLVNVAVSIFQQAWGISSILEIEDSNDSRFYETVFHYYIALIVVTSMVFNSFMKDIMLLYVGKNFFGAWIFVPLLIVSAAFSAISAYFGSLYGALKKSVNNMVTTIVSGLINISINLLLIPIIGTMGAVIGTLLAYISIAFIRLFDIKKYLPLKIHLPLLIINSLLMIIHAVLVTMEKITIGVSLLLIVGVLGINLYTIRYKRG